jgi:outer membrane lipoprotein SlyB
MIPAGAAAEVEVTELKRSENANDNVVMGFRVTSVRFSGHTYPVSATTSYAEVNKVRNEPKNKDIQKVVGGAAIGAIAGQILGHSTKATVIGAAVGGAAGAGAAAATANYEGCVNSGGKITATLNSATQVNI